MTTGLRIDKWLWFARFCKTRSLAQHLIAGGEVTLNGRPVGKTGATVKPGDEIVFPLGRGWRRIAVRALACRRGPAPEARLLYEELVLPADPDALPPSAGESEAGKPWRGL